MYKGPDPAAKMEIPVEVQPFHDLLAHAPDGIVRDATSDVSVFLKTERLMIADRDACSLAAAWLFLAGAGALLALGCGAPRFVPPTNLIVISVDTLRADHMSLYGYERETTPQIAAFAKRSITFDRARAPWPKTVPSMVSMFTSRPPHITGVMFGSRGHRVRDEELLLAEIAQ